MNWVWEHSKTSGTELLLLLAIADCADDVGHNAFPSKHTLAQKTRLDPSTVRRLVKRLEHGGHVTVQRSTGRGRANVYTVLMRDGEQRVDNHVNNRREKGADCRRGDLPPGQDAREREADRPLKGGTTAHPQPQRTILEPQDGSGSGRNTDGIMRAPMITDPVAAEVLRGLGGSWPLTDLDRQRLAPLISEAVISGWPVKGLIAYLSANPKGVNSPVAVLLTRLTNLPRPRRDDNTIPRPEWCGHCDETSRLRERDDGSLLRCPECHPLRVTSAPTEAEVADG